MSEKGRKKIYSAILGGIVFSLSVYYIIFSFQWRNILQVLSHVNLLWLLGAGSCAIFIYWLIRTMRWLILLRSVGVKIPFFRLYLISAISVSFTIITPLQFGEAIKIELLKKSGHLDRMPGYAVFAVEKMLDLMVVLLLAACSIFLGASQLVDLRLLLMIFVAFLSGFIIFLIVVQREEMMENSLVGRFFKPFNQCMKNRKSLLLVTALTICGWLAVALGWYCCLRSISISLTFFQAIALTSIITVVNILSFIPGALGISEVGIAAFLMHLNFSGPIGQAGAVILRIYGLTILFFGLNHYLVMMLCKEKKSSSIIEWR